MSLKELILKDYTMFGSLLRPKRIETDPVGLSLLPRSMLLWPTCHLLALRWRRERYALPRCGDGVHDGARALLFHSTRPMGQEGYYHCLLIYLVDLCVIAAVLKARAPAQ
jgi:hypothetical protein